MIRRAAPFSTSSITALSLLLGNFSSLSSVLQASLVRPYLVAEPSMKESLKQEQTLRNVRRFHFSYTRFRLKLLPNVREPPSQGLQSVIPHHIISR